MDKNIRTNVVDIYKINLLHKLVPGWADGRQVSALQLGPIAGQVSARTCPPIGFWTEMVVVSESGGHFRGSRAISLFGNGGLSRSVGRTGFHSGA